MDAVMNSLAPLFAGGLAAGVVCTAAARGVARRAGLIDRPDGRRKVHPRAVPVAGGVAVFVATVLVLAAASALPGPFAAVAAGDGGLLGLLAGATLLCLVGLVDDARGLPGWWKFLGQAAAVGVVIAAGVRIDGVGLFGWEVRLGAAAVPFTLFWLLGAINSVNLLDGMDGLLGTVGAIICLAVAVLAAMNGHAADACVAAALAGALVGFLRYNLPPASIFMGDAGSMVVGLVVGVLAVRCSLKGTATVALAAPIALMTIPILDTAAAVVRRKLTGRSLLSTDRGHIHHCLLRTGLSRPRVLLLVSALCGLTAVGALGSIACHSEALAVLSAAAVVAVLVATRLFGHAEFVLLLKSGKEFAKRVTKGSAAGGRGLEVRLQGSAGWGAFWAELVEAADEMGLRALALDVNAPAHHEGYHARWRRPDRAAGEDPGYWSAVLPLTAGGQPVGRVSVTGAPDGVPVWKKLAALTELTDRVEEVLAGGSGSEFRVSSFEPETPPGTVPTSAAVPLPTAG